MAKRSAFKEFLSEPQLFNDGNYVVDGEGLWTEDSIVNKFMEEFASWHWITGDKVANLKNLIRKTQKHAWVKWHAGINEDGEPQNMWWLYHQFTPGRKGMKVVYTFQWDKHFVEHGHKYQCTFDEEGRDNWNRECKICTELETAKNQK